MNYQKLVWCLKTQLHFQIPDSLKIRVALMPGDLHCITFDLSMKQ